MAQKVLLEELKKGPASWNNWRRVHPSVHIDLTGAYLAEASLRSYDLRDADLADATLMAADLTGTDLRNANFANADLRFADVSGAKLAGAHFNGAEGVTRQMLRASVPEAEASHRRQLWIIAAVVIAMTILAFWRDPSLLAVAIPVELQSTEPPRQEVEQRVSYEQFTQQLERVEFADWRIEAVAVANDLVTLHINRDNVTDDTYLLTLAAACGALLETPEAPVRMIRVLNRAGDAGWVYENPNNCPALLQAPLATLRLAAAANSRPFVAGLDPGDF